MIAQMGIPLGMGTSWGFPSEEEIPHSYRNPSYVTSLKLLLEIAIDKSYHLGWFYM